jgi:hypothetical protein
MPMTISFDAERAAALDDLLQRRDQRLRRRRGRSAWCRDTCAELLEALAFDQLLQDRALALGRERMFLVRPSMRSWSHAFCSGSEMCMNSTPIGAAIGALQDVEHLAHGRGSRPSTPSMKIGRSMSFGPKP